MKLRMAPNSLFAVLLRSPWWISIAIGAAFALLALAIAPPTWGPLVAAGGLPFLGIGVVALSRQWRMPSAAQSQALLERAASMSWAEFAPVLRRGFERQGYRVETANTPGCDLLLERGGRRAVVAARRWKAARPGEDALMQLRTAAQALDARGCVYVTLADLSPQARRLAKAENIEVLEGPLLAQLLRTGLATS